MSGDADLNINITLTDQMTGALQNAGNALNNFHSNFRQVGRETAMIGTQLTLLGAAITGPFLLAFATWGKTSIEGAGLMEDFGNTMSEIQDKLAQAVAPSFQKMTEVLNGMLDAFNKLNPAQQQSILQGIFETGMMIAKIGVMTTVIGKIIEMASNLSNLAGKFAVFAAANPELVLTLGIMAAVVIVIANMQGGMAFLANTAQVLFSGMAALLESAFAGWYKLAEVIVAVEENIAKALLIVPGINKQVVEQSISYWDQLGNKLADMANNKLAAVDVSLTNLNKAFMGSGTWATGLEGITGTLNKLVASFKDVKTGQDQATDAANNYYKAMTSVEAQLKQVNTDAISSLKTLATLQNEASNQKLLTAKNETTEEENLLKEYEKEYTISQQGMATLQANVAASFQTNMSSALTGIITGTESASKAFQALGAAMLKTIVDYMTQKLVAFVTEHTILAGTVAASSTAANTIAAAWASAAAAVSLATFGSNSVPASAGMVSTETLATALFATPRAFGGDDIVTKPTLFLAGENGPERATFTPLGKGGGMGQQISIYIQNPSLSSNQDITRVAQMLGFKLQQLMRTGGGI